MQERSTRDNDLYRVNHMVRFCEQLTQLRSEISEEDLESDWVTMLAIMRLFETLGEAASKVSTDTKAMHSEIPWNDVKAMRNRLIHGYDDIEYELVWLALEQDVPELLMQLHALASELQSPS
jgi:uncharacterized protein with HEPN domain